MKEHGSICICPNVSVLLSSLWPPEERRAVPVVLHKSGLLGARGRFMLSLGLRARRTPSIAFTRRLTRLPQRRSRSPLPLPFRSDVTSGARSFATYSIAAAFGAGVGFIAYENYPPFRHTLLAVVRCSRVASE